MHAAITRRPGRMLAVLAAAVPALSVLAAAGCAPAAASSRVPAAVIARLTAIARRTAALDGDPHPAWITVVATTHARALASATPGDRVPAGASTRVFLITMRGHFTDRDAPVPPGGQAPAGRYLSMVISARTFAGLDFGLAATRPPVAPSSLGPVTYLSGSRR